MEDGDKRTNDYKRENYWAHNLEMRDEGDDDGLNDALERWASMDGFHLRTGKYQISVNFQQWSEIEVVLREVLECQNLFLL